jgi:hypothetical protein
MYSPEYTHTDDLDFEGYPFFEATGFVLSLSTLSAEP